MPKEALGSVTICIYVQNRGEAGSAYRWKATGQTRIRERALKAFVFRINTFVATYSSFSCWFVVAGRFPTFGRAGFYSASWLMHNLTWLLSRRNEGKALTEVFGNQWK
jgi:hypothetical protein